MIVGLIAGVLCAVGSTSVSDRAATGASRRTCGIHTSLYNMRAATGASRRAFAVRMLARRDARIAAHMLIELIRAAMAVALARKCCCGCSASAPLTSTHHTEYVMQGRSRLAGHGLVTQGRAERSAAVATFSSLSTSVVD